MYSLAADSANHASPNEPRERRTAEAEARQLAAVLARTLLTIDPGWKRVLWFRRRRAALRDFLLEMEPSVWLLLGGLTATKSEGAPRWSLDQVRRQLTDQESAQPTADDLFALAKARRLTPRASYNLACAYTACAARVGEETKKKDLDEAMKALAQAWPGLDKATRRWARDDPSLSGLERDPETKQHFIDLVGNEPTSVGGRLCAVSGRVDRVPALL